MIRNKLLPWQIAQARVALMAPTVIAMMWWGDFWTTWASVYTPKEARCQ